MLGKHGRPKKGEEKKVANGKFNGGNQTTYTVARLRRDRPELAERGLALALGEASR